jgi:hypothetical protein
MIRGHALPTHTRGCLSAYEVELTLMLSLFDNGRTVDKRFEEPPGAGQWRNISIPSEPNTIVGWHPLSNPTFSTKPRRQKGIHAFFLIADTQSGSGWHGLGHYFLASHTEYYFYGSRTKTDTMSGLRWGAFSPRRSINCTNDQKNPIMAKARYIHIEVTNLSSVLISFALDFYVRFNLVTHSKEILTLRLVSWLHSSPCPSSEYSLPSPRRRLER